MKLLKGLCLVAMVLFSIATAQQVNNDVFSEVEPLIKSGSIKSPLDATPDSSGETVYFIATGENGAGVFQVAMQGGSAIEIKAGTPFEKLEGLAISSDDKWIFVADSQAQGGVIFKLSLLDKSVSVLTGTEGSSPKGLEVVGEQLYFTGEDLGNGQMTVFRVSISGGEPVILAKGAPFENLSGVTATKEGLIFVSDRGEGTSQGVVYRVDETVTSLAQDLNLGSPAGLALTPDASMLAVSSLSTDGHAQVLLIDLGTLESSIFNYVIGENTSAGGLHRSHGDEVIFAWADIDNGQVYKVKPPKAQPTGF